MTDAVNQCLEALRTRFVAAGLNVAIDRDESEMLQDVEYPSVALSWLGAEINRIDSCGTYFWRAQVAIDAWAKVGPGKPVLAGCMDQIATCAQVIQNSQVADNFGQMFHDCVPISVSGLEAIGADRGSISMIVSVQYQTAKGDWTTILTA
jgi:hypothetical protein